MKTVLTLHDDGTVDYGTPMSKEDLSTLARKSHTSGDGHAFAIVFLCNEILKLKLELMALKEQIK
jgi:hypothetical protein